MLTTEEERALWGTSVSHGDQRLHILLDAHWRALCMVVPTAPAAYPEWQQDVSYLCAVGSCSYLRDEEETRVIELTGAIGDEINAHLSNATRFGAHPGNSSDFGFWENDDPAYGGLAAFQFLSDEEVVRLEKILEKLVGPEHDDLLNYTREELESRRFATGDDYDDAVHTERVTFKSEVSIWRKL